MTDEIAPRRSLARPVGRSAFRRAPQMESTRLAVRMPATAAFLRTAGAWQLARIAAQTDASHPRRPGDS